jgi:two-component system, NarL family, nitrate/nitrite response regulator NarL
MVIFVTLEVSGKGSHMSEKIRVTILDDHQSIVDGYRFRLGNSQRVQVLVAIGYGDELEPTLEKHPTDVLLLDIGVPTSTDNPNPYPILHVIPTLLQKYPNLIILVISMHAERSMIRAVMDAGSSGYILKDDQTTLRDLENVVISVASGGIHLSRKANDVLLRGATGEHESLLSKRQQEALSLCLAYPNSTTAELAKIMSISNSTIRNLLSSAYIKLGVRTRIAAVTKARQLGLITPEPSTVPLSKAG